MTQMPSIGHSERKRPSGALFWAVLGLVVLGGGLWWLRRKAPVAMAGEPGAASGIDAGNPDASVAIAAPAPSPAADLAKSGWKHAHVTISGPLERSVVEAVGPAVGQPLTQVVTRSLVWWIEVPGDLRKADTLDIVYEERPNQEPVVHAVRFFSSKSDKTFAAYRFKAAAEAFARFYQASGEELELRIKDAPLEDYEQVTSHLRDGRHHKGVDFKTPIGSKVHATFAGTISRKTWNFRGNGNSLEVADGHGRRALYLHMSEIPKNTQVGQHVALGEMIGESGNTGHSFAPHLHYQLMQGEKLLDPFKEHATYRRSLPADQKAAFEALVKRYDAMLKP